MTADEIRIVRDRLDSVGRDMPHSQAYLTVEIAAQLATLNATLERLARAVEQAAEVYVLSTKFPSVR